jgi:hypothetical protein
MKKLLFLVILSAFISCKSNENKEAASTTDSTKVNAATIYTCPMHPEVTSDKPGKCPQCDMDLQIKS